MDDIRDGIDALTARWARLEAENENLSIVLAALILRNGGDSLTLYAAELDAAVRWEGTKGIRILRYEPPLTVEVSLAEKDSS